VMNEVDPEAPCREFRPRSLFDRVASLGGDASVDLSKHVTAIHLSIPAVAEGVT
jgi:hypothetical protein